MKKTKFTVNDLMNKTTSTGKYMHDFLTKDVLKDICQKITGEDEYDVQFNKKRNIGRLITLEYDNQTAYISLSLTVPEGRNSAVQTAAPAYNIYYQSATPNKKLFYYFLGSGVKFETSYLISSYRQMLTIGFEFLNPQKLSQTIRPFYSIEDLIASRKISSDKNSGNNSSYILKASSKKIEIYGKTYGANKYAAAMLGFTAASLVQSEEQDITFYEIIEGNLKHMPKSCKKTLSLMGNVKIISTDIELERKESKTRENLRSPLYTVHLLDRLGNKRCALCNCEIQEIIQGAHIWPISSIKNQETLSHDEKFAHAISGDNGVWLCQNHHKLFDENFINFDKDGTIKYNTDNEANLKFMYRITDEEKLPNIYLSENFLSYLELRNNVI